MAKNSHLEIFQGGDFSEFAERLTFHFLASDIGKVPLSAKLEEKQAAIKKQAAVLVTHLSPSVSGAYLGRTFEGFPVCQLLI